MAIFTGTLKADNYKGTKNADSITGLAGEDALSGYLGDDFIDGGEHNDKLSGGDGNDTLLGGDGDDTLEGGIGNDSLEGGTGDDSLFGGAGSDTLLGGEGDDTLNGGIGKDTLIGGNGSDVYLLSGLEDKIIEDAEGGEDLIISTVSYDLTLATDVENLTLSGTKATSGKGNELDNVIRAIEGSNVKVFLDGADGSDTLLGSKNNDSLKGGTSDDTLDGGAGKDTAIFVGVQDDYNITIEGDTVIVEYIGNEDINDGTDTLFNIEYLQFSNSSPKKPQAIIDEQIAAKQAILNAQELKNKQIAEAEAKAAAEKAAADAKTANDAKIAAEKATTEKLAAELKAEADAKAEAEKTLSLSFKNDDVSPPNDIDKKLILLGTVGNDILSSVNNSKYKTGGWVNGGAGDDTIYGHLNGGTTLKTASSSTNAYNSDTLFGGAGNDSINGTLGEDYLIGGSGVDHLWGGLDTATDNLAQNKSQGELVKDVFLFGVGDSGVGANRDVIEDFGSNKDKIDFVGASVAGVTGLERNLSFIGTQAFNSINQVRYEIDFAAQITIVKLNLDNDPKTTEMEIELTGIKNLLTDDFVLVKA